MRQRFLFALSAVLSVGVAASAESITYTESAMASGSLNGVSFTNAVVTFTGTGDTTSVVEPLPGVFENFVTVQGTVQGLGSFTVTPQTGFFSNGGGEAGVFGLALEDLLVTANATLDGYNLESAFGPVTGTGILNSGLVFATTAGDFDLTSTGDSTFQATVATATPEPGSFALLGTGLLGFAGVLKRRMP